MRVEIWSDLCCPWCYLGNTRFERALNAFPGERVEVVHRSYRVVPGFPYGETIPVLEMWTRKHGGTTADAAASEQGMVDRAASEGLAYSVNRLAGNTLDALRLLHLAKERGREDELRRILYQAHFVEERSIFDLETLIDLAEEARLDPVETRSVLSSDTYTDAVLADEKRAAALGVTRVPFYLIDGRHTLFGNQAASAICEALVLASSHEEPVNAGDRADAAGRVA